MYFPSVSRVREIAAVISGNESLRTCFHRTMSRLGAIRCIFFYLSDDVWTTVGTLTRLDLFKVFDRGLDFVATPVVCSAKRNSGGEGVFFGSEKLTAAMYLVSLVHRKASPDVAWLALSYTVWNR